MTNFQKVKKRFFQNLWTSYTNEQFKKHQLRFIQWEATLRCNFKCKHCGSNASNKTYRDELNTSEIKETFKNIASQVDPSNICIGVTGGEPLLRKDLFEVMDYATSLGFRWTIISNGYFIDKNIVNKLVATNVSNVSISIDGLRKEHNKLRGVDDAFEHAIKAIKLLTELPIESVDILTCLNQFNIKQLDKLYSLLKSLDVSKWRVMTTDLIGRAKKHQKLIITKKQLIYALNFIKKIRNNGSLPTSWGCSGYYGTTFEKEIRDNFFFCQAGVTLASILHNGDIFVCTDVPRKEKLIQGNIREDDFINVWNNKFDFFRDKNSLKSKKCKNCPEWNYCLGGGLHCFDFLNKTPSTCWKDINDLI